MSEARQVCRSLAAYFAQKHSMERFDMAKVLKLNPQAARREFFHFLICKLGAAMRNRPVEDEDMIRRVCDLIDKKPIDFLMLCGTQVLTILPDPVPDPVPEGGSIIPLDPALMDYSPETSNTAADTGEGPNRASTSFGQTGPATERLQASRGENEILVIRPRRKRVSRRKYPANESYMANRLGPIVDGDVGSQSNPVIIEETGSDQERSSRSSTAHISSARPGKRRRTANVFDTPEMMEHGTKAYVGQKSPRIDLTSPGPYKFDNMSPTSATSGPSVASPISPRLWQPYYY